MRIIAEEGDVIKTMTPDESVEETTRVGNKYSTRRECTLSKSMIEALVTQMGVELSNHNLYKTFSNYFKKQGLNKLHTYFLARAEEEKVHFDWIRCYLEYNDAEFIIPAIEMVNVDIPSRVMPFEATIDREIQTTVDIYKIAQKAMDEGDWGTYGWLFGTGPTPGKLIPEQIEEEHVSRQAYKLAILDEVDWLTIQDSIHEYYFTSR